MYIYVTNRDVEATVLFTINTTRQIKSISNVGQTSQFYWKKVKKQTEQT